MKRISVVSIILLLFGLAAVGMFSGYYIGLIRANKKPNPPIENTENKPNKLEDIENDKLIIDDQDDYEAGQVNNEQIGPNTIIKYRTYYTECNHETMETIEPEKPMINMTKESFEGFIKNNHPKWKVEEFSHQKIVVLIEKNHLCQNHYVIGEMNGKIAVFRIDENGKRVIDQVYSDAPISLLKKIDQEKIIKGIITDSKEELSDVLENYIS